MHLRLTNNLFSDHISIHDTPVHREDLFQLFFGNTRRKIANENGLLISGRSRGLNTVDNWAAARD